MHRLFALAAALCLVAPLRAQSPSEQVPIHAAKTAARTSVTSRTKPMPAPILTDNGPCRLGVITAVGDRFAVDKIGLTVFGNEHDEVVADWGLDDLIFARVRAAAGPELPVRRIAYPSGAFEFYYHPRSRFVLAEPRDSLTAIVQGITASAGCERYLVVTRSARELQGTHVLLSGVGVFGRSVGNVVIHTALFANVDLTLLDGRNYAKQSRLGTDLAANFEESLRLFENPLVRLDNASFPEPAAGAAGSAVLRERTRTLVAATVDRLLPGYLKQE